MLKLSSVYLAMLLFFFILNCDNSSGPDSDPLTIAFVVTNESLYGLADGKIDLTITGGKMPYVTEWSNGETIEDINNLEGGTYSVTVTDETGKSVTDSAEVIPSINSTVTDIDGNVYKTVLIGDQWWMAENLKVAHDPEGHPIPNCCYDDNTNNIAAYGRLYTWNAAMDSSITPGAQGIAPDGWHIPSSTEWNILFTFLGGIEEAGGKMKLKGTTYWSAPNVDAVNSSGFCAKGAGEKEGATYQFLKSNALFWTSNQRSESQARYYILYNDKAEVTPFTWNKDLAYSIRCLKD